MPENEGEKCPRVLVVGGGAIGGTVAGHLTHAGAQVTVYVTNERIRAALAQHGFRHLGHTSLRSVPKAQAAASLASEGRPWDLVFLAVQPPQVEAVAQELLPHLAPDARLVCFQNGLCEERVGRVVGDERVYGAVVTWGASMPQPGVYERTSRGGFLLGPLRSDEGGRLEQVATLLRSVGPTRLTGNLLGARWSKLAVNSAVSTLGTIGGCRLGRLLAAPRVRRLALEIMSEAVAVAGAMGVELTRIGPADLSLVALGAHPRAGLRLATQHGLLWLFGQRYRRLRSSMLQAIERGRPPAVDFLNGEVVQHGVRVGAETPVNAAAQRWVWEIAQGRARSGPEALAALYEETRR